MHILSTTRFRTLVLSVFVLLFGSGVVLAQEKSDSQLERSLPPDTTITATDQVTIQGESVPYEVTTGTQPVYGDDDTAIASLHYTYYRRSDVDDRTRRPLVVSFNGGPGSGSLWMHLGYTSPKHLKISDEGYPVQPYGVEDNEHSILDVADIVYVNPVNTGFSRILDDSVDREEFFGVNADVDYLASWIDTFVSRHDRWRSPKYLIGESYGTTRVSGLAGELQNSHWMYLNGVILVSPTGLGMEPAGPSPRSEALKLPYYAATAWYHDQLPSDLQSRDLQALLSEVEDYTVEEYVPALTRGGFIDSTRRQTVAQEVARYSGLSEQFVLNHNLAVPSDAFWKQLLQEEGRTVGRLDSRYRGVDRKNAGSEYDYPPELAAWNHAFTPAANHYLRDELGFETDLKYNVFGPVHPWNEENNDTGEQLRDAMAQNPYLHVMVQSGYFDGATDYFSAKYVMWNLGTRETMRDRLRFEGYRSGHMMYLREEDLETANEHIRSFIEESIPEAGTSARYGPRE
ncbi:carboxypeptidase [Salinibacter sp. 10B]|uniref:S10 family peptidase n=1 Tax=Salinibacter sp. 10B TaxID=1923971 RepID=UPI000CF41D01|nr:carboxypeptidase [Salinibacter sp. 10B]PQJ34515.1 carboxypeptidase [Salinibacter sp. 10B]